MTGLLLATLLATTNFGQCEINTDQPWDGTGVAVLLCDGAVVNEVPIEPGLCTDPEPTVTDALCVLKRATGQSCVACRN